MEPKRALLTILVATIAAACTWYINHDLGYGAIIASSLVGVAAGIILPGDLAGAAYTASFVGMSANFVLPSLAVSILAGIVVGIVIIATGPVYAGVGGKGGTTAATSVLITQGILKVFGL
ncbi:MAG TPA: hypothetical protein GX735_08720 [Firmicutes bacterium]|jgi:hypothetical protein|nr:hypothetical protein [Bacillota bacterium]